MKQVYQLQATGDDWFTGSRQRTISTTTVFTTRELAESKIERFREKLNQVLETPKISVVSLEVIEPEQPCPHGLSRCHCQGHTGPWCGYCLAENSP